MALIEEVMNVFTHIEMNLFFILCTILTFLLTALVYRRVTYNMKYSWPPGPKGWPIIGNSRLIALNSGLTAADITRIGKQYHPDVFTLTLFAGKRILIINSYKSFKEAYVKQSELISGRPNTWPFTYVNEQRRNFGLFFETYSQSWKREKKYMVRTSRHFGYGNTKSQDFILREANHLAELIQKRNGQPFDLSRPLSLCMLNVTFSMLFNTTYEEGDEEFGKILDYFMLFFAEVFIKLYEIEPFLPFLDMFGLSASLKRCQNLTKKISTFIQDHIDQHRKTLDPDHPRDIVDGFLIEIAKNDPNSDLRDFSDEKFMWMVFNTIPDQGDTAPSFFSLLMFATIVQPAVQQRVFEEIQEVIGDRSPTLDDRGKLPYTEAVILETLRIDTPFWLLVPHTTQEDVELLGFKIPKDTTVIPNIFAVHMDPDLWGDPENFRPERFIGEDGRIVKPEYLIPFSLGPRRCFGEQMAQKEFFIFYISLIQKYKFKIPDGDPIPKIEPQWLWLSPPEYRLQAELRE